VDASLFLIEQTVLVQNIIIFSSLGNLSVGAVISRRKLRRRKPSESCQQLATTIAYTASDTCDYKNKFNVGMARMRAKIINYKT